MGSLLREFWFYFRARKRYWLLPVVLILVAVGAVIVLTEGSSIAPFIYAIW